MGGIVKSIGKTIGKIIPNEIKPALPFISAALPFLAPELVGIGGIGGLFTANPTLAGAIGSGLINVGTQAASGNKFNPTSLLLSTASGGLTAPGSASGIASLLRTAGSGSIEDIANSAFNQMETYGGAANISPAVTSAFNQMEPQGSSFLNTGTDYATPASPSLLDKATNTLSTGLQKAANYFQVPQGGILNTTDKPGFFNPSLTTGQIAKDIGAITAQGSYDSAYNALQQQLKQFGGASALQNMSDAQRQAQIDDIIYSMRLAKFPDVQIQDALNRSGFGNVNIPTTTPTPQFKKGGRVEYAMGGFPPYATGIMQARMKKGGRVGLADSINDLNSFLALYGNPKNVSSTLSDYNTYTPKYKTEMKNPHSDIAIGAGVKRFNPREYISNDPAKYAKGIPYTGTHPDLYGMKEYYAGAGTDLNKIGSGAFSYYNPASQEPNYGLNPVITAAAQALNANTKSTPGVIQMKKGGKVKRKGYADSDDQGVQPDALAQRVALANQASLLRDVYNRPSQITQTSMPDEYKKGGKVKGGLLDLHGHEMDYRAAGGFVPIGKKERADDVPARLSKNEFVFTAKAVRAAGDGDAKEGARRMYHIMKQLEARV
jgi:hypothetical protein